MREDRMIEKIYGELTSRLASTDFNFSKYRTDWGRKNTPGWSEVYGMALDDVERLAKVCTLKFYDGKYYIFDGRIYVPCDESVILKAYEMTMRHQRVPQYLISAAVARNNFANVIRFFNPLVPRLDLIAFTNGILDMSNFNAANGYKVKFTDEFSPRYHVTYYHPYPYEPDAKCKMWQSFLHEVLPDKDSRIVLQMFLGLGLIQRKTVYDECEGREAAKVELCLILLGSGANGKSVIYQTAMGIYGPRRISGLDYDDLTASGDEGMRSRSLLRNALFNWSSDSDPRTFGRKRTGVFKRIVSGEPVTDRRIGENVQENFHMPYLVFNLNELPHSDDQTLGFVRRLQFVSFDVTIPPNKQNRNLTNDLKKEYSGIFNWILRGAKELRRKRFMFPETAKNRKQVILAQLQIDPVSAWLNTYRIRAHRNVAGEQGTWISNKFLLQSLWNFCEDNDVEKPSAQKFGHTMTRKQFDKKRIGAGMCYRVYGVDEEDLKDVYIVSEESLDSAGTSEELHYITMED
jgi:phage/plasmid-associated DNA primase